MHITEPTDHFEGNRYSKSVGVVSRVTQKWPNSSRVTWFTCSLEFLDLVWVKSIKLYPLLRRYSLHGKPYTTVYKPHPYHHMYISHDFFFISFVRFTTVLIIGNAWKSYDSVCSYKLVDHVDHTTVIEKSLYTSTTVSSHNLHLLFVLTSFESGKTVWSTYFGEMQDPMRKLIKLTFPYILPIQISSYDFRNVVHSRFLPPKHLFRHQSLTMRWRCLLSSAGDSEEIESLISCVTTFAFNSFSLECKRLLFFPAAMAIFYHEQVCDCTIRFLLP